MKSYCNFPMHILCIAFSTAYILVYPRYEANALSIGKRTIRRPFFRNHNPVVQLGGDNIASLPCDEEDVLASAPSSTRRGKRRSDGFRRAKRRDFQLNYKDAEDDVLVEVNEKRRLRRVLSKIRLRSLRRRRNRRVASEKALMAEEKSFLEDKFFEGDDDSNSAISSYYQPSEQIQTTNINFSSTKVTRPVIRKKKPMTVVSNIHELRSAILDKGLELRDIELNYVPPPSLRSSNSSIAFYQHFNDETLENGRTNIFSHDVLNILHQRYHSHSTPANRSEFDNATLALAIEGGGMRGAVSGGMAAAIVCLGLSNAFDSIYGSSAGSIIGSYFVSRQLYLDVYTDVIPAGFDLFVSKAKIIGDIFRNFFLMMRGESWKRINGLLLERFKIPKGEEMITLKPTREGGLNISFVLDGIMCPDKGLRPLDMESFAHNDEVQPLRIVSSSVDTETGVLKSVVFGSKEGHFCDEFANLHGVNGTNSKALYPEIMSAKADEQGYRRGLWACLGASMSVPGAAGSPFPMDLPSSNSTGTSRHLCFDAFCYEPIPYRSAVAEGATHVLALRSKPAGTEPKTKPTLFERAVAPFYFRSNKAETVAQFFERGGQQYLYVEDVLTCAEGLDAKGPIAIPPTDPIYGCSQEKSDDIKDRSQWARAHLLPITVPADVPELGTLADDRDEIIAGIRGGFAAAYDALAPVVGLEASSELNGTKLAELVFPSVAAPLNDVVLHLLPGIKLDKNSQNNEQQESSSGEITRRKKIHRWLLNQRSFLTRRQYVLPEFLGGPIRVDNVSPAKKQEVSPNDRSHIMAYIPAVQHGSVPLVTERLQTYLDSNNKDE